MVREDRRRTEGPDLNPLVDHALATLPALARWHVGRRVRFPPLARPERPLELYEFEACPYCRKVRETLLELDLPWISRPVPKGERRKRAHVKSRGGKLQFPWLVDPNTGREMYESEAIVTWLHQSWGTERPVPSLVLAPINTAGAVLASWLRPAGTFCRQGFQDRRQPAALLELWDVEGRAACRRVRERLSVLNLDHLVHPAAPGAREEGAAPRLLDPNTGADLDDADDVLDYLEANYGR